MTYLPPPPPPGQPGEPAPPGPDPQYGGYGQQPTQSFPAYPQQDYPGGSPVDPNAGYGAAYGQQPTTGYPPTGYPPPAPPGYGPGAPPPAGGGGPTAKTWIIIGVIVAVLAGGGVAAWLLTGKDTTKKPVAQHPVLGSTAATGLPSASGQVSGFPSQAPTDAGTAGPTTVPTSVPTDIPTSADSALAYLTATRLALAFETHSLPQVKEVACPSSQVSLKQSDLDTVQSATVKGMPQVAGDTGKTVIAMSFTDGTSDDLTVNLAKQSGNWCVDSF